MDADYALNWLDSLVLDKTGHRLSDLQRLILQQVWQGQKYLDIAASYGCTEGHAKDVGSQLWKSLSEILGEKITKQNCRSVTERCLNKARRIKRRIHSRLESKMERLTTRSEASPPVPQAIAPSLSHSASPDLDELETPQAIHSSGFVGRTGAIAHLQQLVQRGQRLIVIQGEGGLGKTTLAQQFLSQQGFERVLELLMAKQTESLVGVERVVEEWLKQDLGDEPGTELGISLSRLKRHLQSRPIGILIDNLEPALDGSGCFVQSHRTYGELLRVLGDAGVQSVTLVTSRDRLCEPGLNLTHYRLPSLDRDAWTEFFTAQNIPVHPPTLHQMHRAYGGNAKAMGLLSGVIQEDMGGDMAAYWAMNQQDVLVEPSLRNLIASQVDRLAAIDPAAYRLFCRMGCFRYQAIARIPPEGLHALLWDSPPDQRCRIIMALKNRSLMECHQGTYGLHPALHAEAIARLRPSPDWEQANRAAARFWTDRIQRIETRQDARQALEAYYHHVAIGDWHAASQVILKSRLNRWNQFLPLGSTLYRLGLLRPVFDAITELVNHLETPDHPPDPSLGELYNILGDLQWIIGHIHAAIASQTKTLQITTLQHSNIPTPQPSNVPTPQPSNAPTPQRPNALTPHQLYYLNMLAIDSSLSLGLYHIDLWELEKAARQFQQVIDQAQNTRHHPWAEKATVCLALVRSYQGEWAIARSLADAVYSVVLTAEAEYTGRFAYFVQLLGQTYVNLGDGEKAQTLLTQALQAAESGEYIQIQARALSGLASLDRSQGRLEQAQRHHAQAVQLLDQLGATCDLAEAYVQWGLTAQALQDTAASQQHFSAALACFQTMDAPRQMARVRHDLER